MMSDPEYLRTKIIALHKLGQVETAKRLVAVNAQFTSAGSFGSGMYRFKIREEMRSSIEAGLLRVATFLVDADAHKDERVMQTFLETSRQFVDETVDGHAAKLFGSPAFGGHEPPGERDRIKADLSEMVELIVEDTRRQIVGHARHQSKGASVHQSTMIVGNFQSPGATAQVAGRDLTVDHASLDREVILAQLAELRKIVSAASLSADQVRALNAATAMVESEIDTSTLDRGALRKAMDWLKSKSDKVQDVAVGVAVAAIEHLIFPT